MSDNQWTAERMAELRRLAKVADEDEVWRSDLDAFADATEPPAILSLLDALECARAERDALVKAVERNAEAMAIECLLGVGEWDACVPSHLREPFFAAYRSIHPEWQG